MGKIDLSIIIPIYNGEKYINNLIDNIKIFNNDITYEIILINDCSKDNSLSTCRKLEEENSNIILINNDKNIGIAESRNKGLKASNGDFITFIDQDDSLIKGYLEFINKIKEYDTDFIYSNYVTTNNNNNNKTLIEINKKDSICNKEEILKLERYLFDPNIFSIKDKNIDIKSTIWNCIFKKSFIKDNDIHFFRYTSYEDDWLFMIESLKHANKIYLYNDSYYSWTVNNKSESHVNKYIENYFKKSLDLLDYAINSLKETGLKEEDLKDYKLRCNSNIMLWNFYNECESDINIKQNDNIKQLVEYYKDSIKDFINISSTYNKIIYTLIKLKLYSTVKFIQTKITKRKYV